MNEKIQEKTKNRSTARTILDTIDRVLNNPFIVGLSLSLFFIPVYYLVLPFFYRTTAQDEMLLMNFIDWLGIPYGLLIISILVKVWFNFDAVDREFTREAKAISDFTNFVSLITKRRPQPGKSFSINQIEDGMYLYTKHVIENYATEASDRLLESYGDKLLLNLKVHIGKVSKRQTSFSELELINLLNQIIDARRERLTLSQQRMPNFIWYLLIISSTLWLLPFYTLPFSSAYIGLVLVGGLTFVIVSLLLIIKDLDDPFGGTWIINLDIWSENLDEAKNKMVKM